LHISFEILIDLFALWLLHAIIDYHCTVSEKLIDSSFAQVVLDASVR